MDEKGLDSPKDLAKRLYELGLVHVKTRENYNSPERDRDNAILSIEKKIVRHIKSGTVSDQNGEYILAYSKFFGCSADYILALTNIRTPDVETRRICELLGLSETVVAELMKCHKEAENPIPGCWSLLMDSPLLYSLPSDIITMGKELQLMYQHECTLTALLRERTKKSGSDLMDINLDIEGQQQEMESRRSAFYGMLSKVSRSLEEMIEHHLVMTYAPFRTMFAEEMRIDT
ncbi:MAG: hypothetical protein K2P41_03405, partial [Lachnospiraceae bacterium]|nr:hypothetical protein [Lachnospiraceae bacterium]